MIFGSSIWMGRCNGTAAASSLVRQIRGRAIGNSTILGWAIGNSLVQRENWQPLGIFDPGHAVCPAKHFKAVSPAGRPRPAFAQRIGQPIEASHEMHERGALKVGNVVIIVIVHVSSRDLATSTVSGS